MDTPDLKSRIRLLSTELFAEVVRHRRYLHQNPELSFEEEQTAAYVAGRLDEMGIPYQKGIGGHGLVAHIRGRNPDRALVALRGVFWILLPVGVRCCLSRVVGLSLIPLRTKQTARLKKCPWLLKSATLVR